MNARHNLQLKLAPFALLLVSAAWGLAFVVMKPAIERQSVNNFLFTRFLMDSPDINFDFVFEVIDLYCNAPERMALGISTLRDIILYRPAVRVRCIPMLLQLCRHKRNFLF